MYQVILQRYPGAQGLAQELAPKITSGELSIENALREYANHYDQRIRAHFKEIPPYLRDLIALCSRDYVDIPSCYTQLAYRLLAHVPHDILFLVLNYDDLLEQALILFELEFTDISHYVMEDRQAKVVKIHGSINWFKPLAGRASDWEIIVKRLDMTQRPADNEIIVRNSVVSTKGSESGGNAIYPLITAPLAGKNLTEPECPNEHLDRAREFLEDCQKFLIVGTSGLDGDLMEFLDSAVDPGRNPNIYLMVVDSGQSTYQTLFKFQDGVSAFRLFSGNRGQILFTRGFREFVSGEGNRTFAEHQPP